MFIVQYTSVVHGFQNIPQQQLWWKYGLSLGDAKIKLDQLVRGRTIEVQVSTYEQALTLVEQSRAIGAVCEIKKQETTSHQ
jgi:hypothetical protein